MSMWIHVAGVVRVDSFVPISNEQIETIFGKSCLWGSSKELWHELRNFPERFLPSGSEGTLKLSIWHNPDSSALASTVVTIFGDLRDCCSVEHIITWFKEKCCLCDKQFMVRQAVVTVDPGFLEAVSYIYEGIEETDNDN